MRVNNRDFRSNDEYTRSIQDILCLRSFDLDLFRELTISIKEDYNLTDLYLINAYLMDQKCIGLTPYIPWEKLKSYLYSPGNDHSKLTSKHWKDIKVFQIKQKLVGIVDNDIVKSVQFDIENKNRTFDRVSPGHKIIVSPKIGESISLSVCYYKS